MVQMEPSRSLQIKEASGRYRMTMCEFASFYFRALVMVTLDSHPDWRSLLVDRKLRLKALGDKTHVPCLQNMGMYVRVPPTTSTGAEVFVRLAKGYVVPEKATKKKEVCALNAEVSGARISLADAGELISCLS